MSFETIWVKVRADMVDFDRKMAGMKSSLNRVGNSMKSVGGSMTAGLTVPIALFGAATLKAAGDFEAGMNKVQAMSNATEKEFESLRGLAKDLGRTTQFSASQSADAMGFLAMAGLEANKILSAMPDTLNLAASANLDFASTADIITNVLTGMKVPMEELPNAVDVLAKAFTSSNTDLLQLGEAMAKVGPVSANFGISLEETTAALGLLGNAGMQAGIAGTGFRRILTKLITSQDKLGITTVDSTGKLKPFADIIEDLEKKAFSGADAMEVFGDRGGPAMINLMAAGSKSIRNFTETLEDSGGTASRIAKIQMEGLNGAIKSVKSAFEAFQISLGESGLLQWVADFAKGIAEFFRNASQANPALMRMGIAIAAIVAVIGPLALMMGALVTAAGAMIGPIALVVGGLAALAAVSANSALAGKSHTQAVKDERTQVNLLVGKLRLSTTSEQDRLTILKKLKEIAPDIAKTIDEEGFATIRTTGALKDYNRQFAKKIIMAGKQDELQKLSNKEAEETISLAEKETKQLEALNKIRLKGTEHQKHVIEQGELAGVSYADIADQIAKTVDMRDLYNRAVKHEVNMNEKNLVSLFNSNAALKQQTTSYNEAAKSVDEFISKNEELQEKLATSTTTAVGETVPTPTGGGSETDVATVAGELTLEAAAQLQILKLQLGRNQLQNDFLGLIRNAVAIRRIEMGLIDEQIAKAEKLAKKEPTDENLAKIIELNTRKLELEQKFSDDISQIKADRRTKDKENRDLETEQLILDTEKRLQIEADALKVSEAQAEKRRQLATAVGDAVSMAMQNMGNAISSGLTKSESGFKRFLGVMVGVTTKLIAMMLSTSIANAIAGGTQSGAATGPAAVFTTPAFIATAIGGVMTAFSAIPKFAEGGLVYGPTMAMVGDNPNARRDPEIISPLSKLKGIIGNSGGGQVEVYGVISGEDIYLSSREYERKLANTN